MKKTTKAGTLIINVISLLLMLLILVAALSLFVAKLQNKPVFVFGRATVWILTNSMEETIPAGSYILIERVSAAEVEAGDVIMFYSDDPALHGALNTHRVVSVVGDHAAFVTKGDHNPISDTVPAAGDKVVGRYVRNMPLFTLVGRLFRSVWGLVILFALTGATVFCTFAGRRKDTKEAATGEKTDDFDARVRAEIERLRAADAAKKAAEATPASKPEEAEKTPAVENSSEKSTSQDK